jgi:hypothetical protein
LERDFSYRVVGEEVTRAAEIARKLKARRTSILLKLNERLAFRLEI